MSFQGFPESALVFYEGLEADNSKAYWTDHRQQYEDDVRAPMEALLAELEPEFGPAKLFRPYRDVRFSKDKTPYKTQAAAAAHGGDSTGALYLALSAEGLFLAGGYWQTTTDQARRLRAAVADDRTGAALAALLSTLTTQGWAVDGDRLVRVPKPWDGTHPRADLLRLKTLTASRSSGPAPWLHTRRARPRVEQAWRQLGPLNAWLHQHVGPPQDSRQH